jgi:hypothetical protein
LALRALIKKRIAYLAWRVILIIMEELKDELEKFDIVSRFTSFTTHWDRVSFAKFAFWLPKADP